MFKLQFLTSFVTEFLIIFVIISALLWYFYYLYCFTYWKKNNVPSIKPTFPAGNVGKSVLGRENLFLTVANAYKEFKKQGHRHGGMYFFNGPVYIPVDPEITKAILTTEAEYFLDRGVFEDEKNFPISGNLFSFTGARWKHMRNKLSPTFTSGKLKYMYEIFLKMAENFVETVETNLEKSEEVNIKYISANFTADIIFSTAFGLEAETLKYPDNRLSKATRDVFNAPIKLLLQTLITEGFQNPGNLLKVGSINKPVVNFFTNIVKNTMRQRDEEKVIRKDFFSLLLEIRDREGLTFDEIAAQCFLFFIAGFETSSQTISYCIHELAHNQEIQDRLRTEIYENLGKDIKKYTYEDVFKLPYLDQVFNETLRLYPVLGFFNRICVKPFKVPGTDVVIEKGTPTLIPVLGLQRDPEYFPEPLKFDPERFAEGKNLTPFTFLPFGDGPRFCIGMRHGKLQTKLGIVSLISKFKFFPSPKTPKVIEFDKLARSLAMTPTAGITVRAVKITN